MGDAITAILTGLTPTTMFGQLLKIVPIVVLGVLVGFAIHMLKNAIQTVVNSAWEKKHYDLEEMPDGSYQRSRYHD